MDLKDIYRKFHLNAAEYKLFSSVHGTFSRIDHMFDHNTMRQEIRYKKKNVKNTNMWRLNNRLLNNQCITE